jgi:hypothetical protein
MSPNFWRERNWKQKNAFLCRKINHMSNVLWDDIIYKARKEFFSQCVWEAKKANFTKWTDIWEQMLRNGTSVGSLRSQTLWTSLNVMGLIVIIVIWRLSSVVVGGPIESRVARWFIFKPKLQIWVNFGGPWNGKYWHILWPFEIYYGHLVYYISFG